MQLGYVQNQGFSNSHILTCITFQAMGAMNRGLNLPQIQRIMLEFEKESATMDMKEEMMSDAVDDVMDDELEDEEEEGDKILKQVLDEIGVDLSQQVFFLFFSLP